MKACDICGTLNLKENNYCTHCGNKLILEHICPFCGENNSDFAVYCAKCKSQINPIRIEDFETLFSEFNQNLLQNAQISDEQYHQILSTIFIRADYFDVWGDTVKNKILNLASVFTECNPKARGYERGFIFVGNGIYYDDRLEDSIQIATIIHELAHFLLFTIIESLLCHILKVNSSSTLQSFVWYFLTRPEFKIMNEYCAHTVEGRFIPYGHQNYGSFNVLAESYGFDDESLDSMIILGNSFANEIIVYLEKYIDEELRNEIKLQYKKDLIQPTYESIFKETTNSFSLDVKNSILLKTLYDVLKEVLDNEDISELESIRESIELG
ncbi:MAG: zinc ribbon domain-containing protein [Methanobrevibacter thaueri]|uniref:Zinc ribbon domain-containing protein n=1 Tax=Methanobrevibacter thaueri TaxID=190975 RepID=A0A8T3VFC3_9EURY|nr:zinc ribbon domain-containing protein [Methanobrevibacter thaueri]MBE6501308.1 zinc ribbon domain-containing protein [Methanobrevibacter thaueri]